MSAWLVTNDALNKRHNDSWFEPHATRGAETQDAIGRFGHTMTLSRCSVPV